MTIYGIPYHIIYELTTFIAIQGVDYQTISNIAMTVDVHD